MASADKSLAGDLNWKTYSNDRFGTTADYPASIFTVLAPPPENGDGQTFETGDRRATLLIYGSWNANRQTPKSYVQDLKIAQPGDYVRVTGTYFVASGVRGDKITYQRCNFAKAADGPIGCINLSYPAQEKSQWDAIVTRIGNSLRTEGSPAKTKRR